MRETGTGTSPARSGAIRPGRVNAATPPMRPPPARIHRISPTPRPTAKQNRELVQWAHQRGDEGQHGGHREQAAADRGARETDQRLPDDRQHDRRDAAKNRHHGGQPAGTNVGPGDRADDHEGGQDERGSGDQQPGHARTQAAEMNGELGGVGARNQVRGADEIEERLARDPAAAAHDLVFHQRDMRGRTAESDRAQLQEDDGQLTQPSGVHRVV